MWVFGIIINRKIHFIRFFALIILGGHSEMSTNDDKIVKEILDKCKKKNIRVHFILKFNSGVYKCLDYFIAPPIEDVGGERIGCRKRQVVFN